MKSMTDTLKTAVIEYCSGIGSDPLLVQGAGGNVSWKDGATLWVKASGTWLAEAAEKDIFVAVDLPHLRSAIDSGDFAVTPKLREESVLRPSIETLLHALMPQRVVVHLHAIEILAYLVRANCRTELESLLDASIHWTLVDYHKPGAALANAVSDALARKPNVEVIFLKNHGVVIGGADVVEVNHLLQKLTAALTTAPVNLCGETPPVAPTRLGQSEQYLPVKDAALHQLALNSELFNRLATDWALYPDHVVFLGAHAFTYNTREDFLEEIKDQNELPELIFIRGLGAFARSTFNKAKQAQLRCYYDVIVRQPSSTTFNALTPTQIAELLNWDAEQYRMNLRQ